MKKVMIFMVMALLCVCACGCINSTGHFSAIMCVSNQTSDSFNMQYERLNGEKTYSFKADAGAVLDVMFVTDSGSLSCVVTDKKGNEYYRNDDVQTEELTIKLGEKEKYYVTLRAVDHKGAFYFTIR